MTTTNRADELRQELEPFEPFATKGRGDRRIPISEAQLERATDREVQNELRRDPRYRHAENAEQQAEAEAAIERECVVRLAARYRLEELSDDEAGELLDAAIHRQTGRHPQDG